MSRVIEDTITERDFVINKLHFESLKEPNNDDKFRYALCLIKFKNRKRCDYAIKIFQNIIEMTDDLLLKRDCFYYIAIGEAKFHNYDKAIDCLNEIVKIKQCNAQVYELYEEINRRYKRNALIGLGITAGASSALIIGMGFYGFIKVASALVKSIR